MGKHNLPKQENNKTKLAVVLGSGALASGLLVASFNPTLSGFVASIQNNVNGTTMGTLTMQETNADGTVTCNSTDGANNTATTFKNNLYSPNRQYHQQYHYHQR